MYKYLPWIECTCNPGTNILNRQGNTYIKEENKPGESVMGKARSVTNVAEKRNGRKKPRHHYSNSRRDFRERSSLTHAGGRSSSEIHSKCC